MSRSSRPLDRAHDVIAGRIRVSLPELFELIHAVNPTSRSRRASETAREYEAKARLQSLLIRTHGDELHVAAEADGTIAINHRYSNRDGCHAQLDALDDEARAWIRWQLDTGDAVEVVASGPSRVTAPSSPGGALARGRQALADYDFEAAVSLFREAMDETGGVDATRALLEVLVDSLALDDEALGLEVGDEVAEDSEVRSLLGLAAARAGHADRARDWLARTSGQRAAEAWSVLAHQALEQAAWQEAEHALRETERLDPAHPAALELRARLVAARADARKPEEDALHALAAAGDDEATEVRAREILARWPDSAIAGRTVAAIEARRRTRTGEAHRSGACDALDRGDHERARELAQRAAALGVDVREIVARIETVVRESRATRDTATVEETGTALRVDEPRGMVMYLELGAELRTRVRAGADDATALAWLDELVPAERGKSRSGDVTRAVVAMREARTAAAAGEYERALALLDGQPALAELRDARVLRTRARDEVAARRQREAEAVLDAAAAAWEAQDLATAVRLLEQVDRRALQPAHRARAEQLAASLSRRRDLETRMQRIDELVAGCDAVGARRELDAVLANPDHDRHAVDARLELVRAALRASWQVRTTTRAGFGPRQLGELIGDLPGEGTSKDWVSADGHVVLVAAHGHHLFVAAFHVATEHATIHYLRTPVALGRHAIRCLDGDRLWIAGDRDVLQLDWRTGDIVRWESLDRFLGEAGRLEDLIFVPASRAMWLEIRVVDVGETRCIVDLDRWAIVRSVNSAQYMFAIPGAEPLLGALHYNTGAALYGGRGNAVGDIVELGTRRIVAIAQHPEHARMVVAASPRDDADDAEVSIYDVVPGRLLRPLLIPESNPDMTFLLQPVRGQGRVFAYTETDHGPELLQLEARGNGLEVTAQIAAPADVVFAHGPGSREGYVLWSSNTGVHAAKLGEHLPDFGTPRERERLPALHPRFMCAPSGVAVFEGLDEAMTAGRWADVCTRLEEADIDALSPPHREHYHHVLGLAYARRGDHAKAEAIWKDGLADDPEDRMLSCNLDVCLKIVEDLDDGEGDASEHPITTVRRAIAKAAILRSSGDVAGALAVLRDPCVYRTRERQGLARLAETWLALPDDSAWFDKAPALAQFLSVANDELRDMPIPDAWDERRIAEIATAVHAWFDADVEQHLSSQPE